MQNYSEHLKPLIHRPGKKRMLSIDGGGIRGVIALEVLAEIERVLRQETKNPDLKLGHWFDFIAGCSTGAIIAAGLSAGMSVSELREIYDGYGSKMFKRAQWWTRLVFHRYLHGELAELLKERFGPETTMGSASLQTLLMVILKNATTDSPWPLTNNPFAKYNNRALPDCNLQLPLWQIIRASTAAPTFFAPESILLPGQAKPFVFVDGALTPYNNPAFLMYLMATQPAYNICWQPSVDKLLIVSVGTGLHPKSSPDLSPRKMHKAYTTTAAPASLIHAAINEQDMLCRVFGRCLQGEALDSELGTMIDENDAVPDRKLFTYLRYNVDLTLQGLTSIGCGQLAQKPLYQMDAVELIHDMQTVGAAIGQQRVRANHFKSFLDR